MDSALALRLDLFFATLFSPFPNFDLVQVSHVEERKNDQIEHIKKSHEKAFNEIKNYYNDITLNNLAMIATLKEEIKERDVKIERSEKQVSHLSQCSDATFYPQLKMQAL